MRKSKKKLFLLLLISGIIFLCAGIFLSAKATKFERNGIKTQAEVVRIEREYDANYKEEISVYVKYTVGNTTYTRELDYYASGLYEGDIVTILYLPDDPASITYAKTQFLPPVLFYVGAGICLGFGVFVALSGVVGGGRLKRLKENGQKVTAIIKRFDYNRNTRVGGKHPATLTCADSFGNTYETKFLYEYGRHFNIGDTITVYVDSVNEKKYAIDVQEYLTREIEVDPSKAPII